MGAGEVAEDVVQDMYIRVSKYASDKKLCTTYIWFTMRNILHDYKKKEARLRTIDLDNCVELEQMDNLEEEAGYQAFLDRLDNEMKTWHWFDRMLFDIYVNKGKSMRELAKGTNIGVSTIFHTIARCKKKIKDNLGEDWEDFLNGDHERNQDISK